MANYTTNRNKTRTLDSALKQNIEPQVFKLVFDAIEQGTLSTAEQVKDALTKVSNARYLCQKALTKTSGDITAANVEKLSNDIAARISAKESARAAVIAELAEAVKNTAEAAEAADAAFRKAVNAKTPNADKIAELALAMASAKTEAEKAEKAASNEELIETLTAARISDVTTMYSEEILSGIEYFINASKYGAF